MILQILCREGDRVKINGHSWFHNLWTNSKTKLKLKHLWEQEGPLVFLRSLRILHIWRIGSGTEPGEKNKFKQVIDWHML